MCADFTRAIASVAAAGERSCGMIATAPRRATPDMYETLSDEIGRSRDTRDRENVVGAKAIAVPGALKGWCEALARFGTLTLADILQPAIGLAERGFVVTPYLSNCITDNAADLARHDLIVEDRNDCFFYHLVSRWLLRLMQIVVERAARKPGKLQQRF